MLEHWKWHFRASRFQNFLRPLVSHSHLHSVLFKSKPPALQNILKPLMGGLVWKSFKWLWTLTPCQSHLEAAPCNPTSSRSNPYFKGKYFVICKQIPRVMLPISIDYSAAQISPSYAYMYMSLFMHSHKFLYMKHCWSSKRHIIIMGVKKALADANYTHVFWFGDIWAALYSTAQN